MRRKYFRGLAVFTAAAILFGAVRGATPAEAANSGLPEELTLPITLIDYNADNLLFQYDLGDAAIGANFSFSTEKFVNSVSGNGVVRGLIPEHLTNNDYAMGLVESHLENGHPVYKQAVVEQVAKLIQDQLVQPAAGDTAPAFSALRTKLQRAGAHNYTNITDNTDCRLTGTLRYYYDADGYGWTISGGDASYTKVDGTIYSAATGNIVWEPDGDRVTYRGDGNADDTLLLTLDGLNPGDEYYIDRWKGGTAELEVSVSAGNAPKNIGEHFTGTDTVQLAIAPTSSSAGGQIAAVKIFNVTSGTEEKILDIKGYVNNEFTNSGWYIKGNDTYYYAVDENDRPYAYKLSGGVKEMVWRLVGDGLVGYITDSVACMDLAVNPNMDYTLAYSYGSDMSIDVYEGSNPLAVGLKAGDIFTAGTTGSIRLEVHSSNQAAPTGNVDGEYTRDKMVRLSVLERPYELGDYEQSKSKFSDTAKGYADVTTCMDYAYYMLNNLFTAKTEDGVKAVYNDYDSITLSQVTKGKDDYEFRADVSGVPVRREGTTVAAPLDEWYKIVYDKENKNIRNDRTETEVHDGLFPLDDADTMEHGYTTYPDANGVTREHNFHYALQAHSEFHYDKNANLYFTFLGDDDVYLFINDQLVLDLGGAHLAGTKTIYLNELQDELGLVSGNNYKFDFFYLERHTFVSNFYIETNIQLLPVGALNMNFYQNGVQLADGSTVEKGSVVELEYVLSSRVDDMKDIDFADEGLGIKVGMSGLQYGSRIQVASGGITVRKYNSNGTVAETKTFKTPEEVRAYFQTLVLNKGESISVRGLLYTVEDKLNAAVTVTMDTPKYAGANGVYVANAVSDDGTLQVKEPSKSTPKPESGGTGGQNTTDNPSRPTAVTSPRTQDSVTAVDFTLIGGGCMLGVLLLCGCGYTRLRGREEQSADN